MKKRNRVCAALMLLAVMLLCGCSKRAKETDEVTTGIDVAKYQGIIDWQQAAGAGLDFAVVRVGYRTMADGELREDPSARYNLQEAAKNGFPSVPACPSSR